MNMIKDELVLNGIVERIVFHSDSTGYTVIEMSCAGELITAVGDFTDLSPGEEVSVTGLWTTHTSYGRQFRVSTYTRSLPDTAAKLYKYLASGAIKGIGPKTALKIIEKFGERTFDILENDPQKLSSVNGISVQKAVDICAEFKQQYAVRKIMIELESYGLSASECSSVYKYYGSDALETVKTNPYILCRTVPGFSFDKAEMLSTRLDYEPNKYYRYEAGIIHILKHNLMNGHTCLPEKKVISTACQLLGADETELSEFTYELIDTKQIVRTEFNSESFLYLPSLYSAERFIAERMESILRFPPASLASLSEQIDKVQKRNGINYASKQREAIITAAEKGLLILTGGPGTGKTTAIKGIIDIFDSAHIEVLLCAPTGRAAKRLSEVSGKEAKTIHRLLEVEWTDEEKPVFKRNAQDPLRCGAVIVDEMSMVDAELFAALLDAIPLSCRIILAGDSDQLPSVGPGNVLGDLISTGVLPVVCLTEIFRQAQQSLIVMNAHRIMNNEKLILNSTDNDFFFIQRDTPESTAMLVADLISKRLPKAYGVSPLNDIQILCPSRKGDCGTVNLNVRLQQILNPADSFKKETSTSGGRIFREGDRVMQIKNNYNLKWTKGYEEGEGIFNGDIGIIININRTAGFMTVLFDDRETEYPVDNLSELELAYAITVHKSQGNEYPVVIIPVIDCPPMLTYRNLLYTAVTRSKRLLVLVGNEKTVLSMAENNRQNKRYSGLSYFLSE